jgi:hypothetical protein
VRCSRKLLWVSVRARVWEMRLRSYSPSAREIASRVWESAMPVRMSLVWKRERKPSAIRAIDQEIGRLEKRISGYERLLAEREHLLRARAALTGEPSKQAARVKRVSQDEIAVFIEEHPGS